MRRPRLWNYKSCAWYDCVPDVRLFYRISKGALVQREDTIGMTFTNEAEMPKEFLLESLSVGNIR